MLVGAVIPANAGICLSKRRKTHFSLWWSYLQQIYGLQLKYIHYKNISIQFVGENTNKGRLPLTLRFLNSAPLHQE